MGVKNRPKRNFLLACGFFALAPEAVRNAPINRKSLHPQKLIKGHSGAVIPFSLSPFFCANFKNIPRGEDTTHRYLRRVTPSGKFRDPHEISPLCCMYAASASGNERQDLRITICSGRPLHLSLPERADTLLSIVLSRPVLSAPKPTQSMQYSSFTTT